MKVVNNMSNKNKRNTFAIVAVAIIILAIGAGSGNKGKKETSVSNETTTSSISETQSTEPTITTVESVTTIDNAEEDNSIKLNTGELIDIKENGTTVIVKAKINSQMTNKLTINQNYHNVADLICNQGFDKYEELQYWAVSDSTDGDEIKIISFTLDKNLIEQTASKQLLPTQYEDCVLDLWILPSLKQ